jgi:hypothetical protein
VTWTFRIVCFWTWGHHIIHYLSSYGHGGDVESSGGVLLTTSLNSAIDRFIWYL